MAVKLVITRREVVKLQCCSANQDGVVVEQDCRAFGREEKKKLLDAFRREEKMIFIFYFLFFLLRAVGFVP